MDACCGSGFCSFGFEKAGFKVGGFEVRLVDDALALQLGRLRLYHKWRS